MLYNMRRKSVAVIHGQLHMFLKNLWKRHISYVILFQGI